MAATREVNDGNDGGGVMLNALAPIRDYLLYTVTVSGAQPDFELVEQGTVKVLLEPDAPPKRTYTRRWPNKSELAALAPGDLFKHILGMKFLGAASYRFVVERFDADDEPREVITDITWSSQQPETTRFETFTVSIPDF